MFSSTQQATLCQGNVKELPVLNTSVHGIHCSDVHCVLPICVNSKLAKRSSKDTRVTNKRCLRTGMGRDGSVKSRRINRMGGTRIIGRSNLKLGQDAATLQQLIDDLDEFDSTLGRTRADIGRNGTDIQQPYVTRDDFPPLPINLQSAKYNTTTEKEVSVATDMPHRLPICPEEQPFISTHRLPNAMEEFISIQPFISAQGKSADGAGRKMIRREHQPDSVIQDTIRIGCKEIKKQSGVQPSSELFGLLSQILQFFQIPMNADLGAFYVRVLQRARTEIQAAHAMFFRQLDVTRYKDTVKPPAVDTTSKGHVNYP